MKKIKMTIYILFGLLCVFSCNKEQNEKSDDVVNKQIESVSSVSNEETETSVLLDTNTLETFEPLSENEIFSYEKPSKENGFALKIDRVDLSTENKTYYKKYTNFLDYLFQTEDKKGLLFQVRNRGKFELHFLDGKNGTIKKIYEHQSPFDTRSSSKSDFIVIFNKDDELIFFNTEMNEIFFQKKIEYKPETSIGFVYSEIMSKITFHINKDEMTLGEYIFILSEDKTSVISDIYNDYESPSEKTEQNSSDFDPLNNDEIIEFEINENKYDFYRKNLLDDSKEKLISLENIDDIKVSKNSDKVFFIKQEPSLKMLYVLDGTKGKLLNILPCFGKYQINETGSFILVQKSNNSVLLFHSGDIVMTYNCDLPSETSQILEIKYENDNFLVEMGDETGILSRQEIILK